jgi:hypothetical protein
MNTVFRDLNFWNLFIFLEREDIEGDMIDKQLDALSADFSSKSGQNRYSHDGDNIQEDYSIIFFDFDLGPDYLLQLEYIPRPEGSAKYLHLKDKKNNTLYLMGWWDLDAWHPYCLMEEELLAINNYVKNQKTGPFSESDLSLLLLHDFVGFDSPEKAEQFAQLIFDSFKKLQIEGFAKSDPKPVAVFYQEDEAYNWKKDAILGSVFESKIYNCYSLRNAQHSKGEEKGRFPFEEWKKLMEDFPKI